ncbi:MAG: nucleoside deaminase [Candidatus Marinimicrobia bacterium]|nr:nucleoside deaminase [Candidatus Neomarinimicrobiota bacterium]
MNQNQFQILNKFMKIALQQAQIAYDKNETPVGAIIVHEGKIIGKGFNQVEKLQDATAHAEIIAITSAENTIGNWRLKNCDIYVTLEPCIMCAGAIINSRIRNVYFGAYDKKLGGCTSLYNLCNDPRLNHKSGIKGGIMEIDCNWILNEFFQKIRQK